MRRSPTQQAILDEAMTAFIAANDYPSDRAAWSVEQRQAYIRAMAEFIVSRPDVFDADDVAARRNQLGIDFGAPVQATPVRVFFSEFGKQATRLNPFSEGNTFFGNASMTVRFLSVAAAVAGAAYIVHLTNKKK